MADKRQENAAATPSEPLIQERGRIQRGEGGDKIAGVDPAAAPLETDSEAGGAELRSQAPADHPGSAADPNASSYADAMREPDEPERRSWIGGPMIALCVIVVVGALLLIIM